MHFRLVSFSCLKLYPTVCLINARPSLSFTKWPILTRRQLPTFLGGMKHGLFTPAQPHFNVAISRILVTLVQVLGSSSEVIAERCLRLLTTQATAKFHIHTHSPNSILLFPPLLSVPWQGHTVLQACSLPAVSSTSHLSRGSLHFFFSHGFVFPLLYF